MTILPFVCLGLGVCLGLFVKSGTLSAISEKLSTVALMCLMLTIGLGIGLDEDIVRSFIKIGFHCAVIAILAIGCSVLCTVICEKTVLPLHKIDEELKRRNLNVFSAADDRALMEESKEVSKKDIKKRNTGGRSLVWIMPASILSGLLLGIIFREIAEPSIFDPFFTVFLIVLYICVGISQGSNKEVFSFIKLLGFRIVWLSAAILIGSILGGLLAGILLGLPLHISAVSASGMSFYSITGAYMTDAYGLEAGTYGFIVNVMREMFTILFMPLLIKISPGSPIAGGAAGNMDTMLAPVTKFVGVRLGLVTLITGTLLTFLVPFLLPIVSAVLM